MTRGACRACRCGRAQLRFTAARQRGSGPARPLDYSPANADRCDITDPAVCLQPFPNDLFTVKDRGYRNGLRVNIDLQSMPQEQRGNAIDPADVNRNDGFSPGSPIVTRVAGMDTPRALRKTGPRRSTIRAGAFAAGRRSSSSTRRRFKRQLIWAELDSNPADPVDVNLEIHPAKNLAEGARYIVALRRMRDAQGTSAPADQGISRLSRPPGHDRPRRRGAPGPLREHLPHARQGRDRASHPLPRLGLHRREPPQPLRAPALDSQRRLREA